MNQVCENATQFLTDLIADLRFDLTVTSEWTDEGCVLNLSGNDAHLALAENGELLDALEVILFQVYGRELDREHRFIVDAEGFKAAKEAVEGGQVLDRPGEDGLDPLGGRCQVELAEFGEQRTPEAAPNAELVERRHARHHGPRSRCGRHPTGVVATFDVFRSQRAALRTAAPTKSRPTK